MLIKHKKHLGSFPKSDLCPQSDLNEFALIGRSNVGKSSLINALLNDQTMARVSQSPGKTRLINLFEVNQQWILCDLPGFGYAKVSKTERQKFDTMIRYYMQNRPNLTNVFLLIDSNIPPQKMDIDFANFLGELGMPFNFIFTKTDKITPRELKHNLIVFENEMLKTWDEMPKYFISSAEKKHGLTAILEHIQTLSNTANEVE